MSSALSASSSASSGGGLSSGGFSSGTSSSSHKRTRSRGGGAGDSSSSSSTDHGGAGELRVASEHGAARMFGQCRMRLCLPPNDEALPLQQLLGRLLFPAKYLQQQQHDRRELGDGEGADAVGGAEALGELFGSAEEVQRAALDTLISGGHRRTLVQGEMLRAYVVVHTPLPRQARTAPPSCATADASDVSAQQGGGGDDRRSSLDDNDSRGVKTSLAEQQPGGDATDVQTDPSVDEGTTDGDGVVTGGTSSLIAEDETAPKLPGQDDEEDDDAVEIDESNVWAAYARTSTSAFSEDDLEYFRQVFERVRIELELHTDATSGAVGSVSSPIGTKSPPNTTSRAPRGTIPQHGRIVQRKPRHVPAGLDSEDVCASLLANVLAEHSRSPGVEDEKRDDTEGSTESDFIDEESNLYSTGRPWASGRVVSLPGSNFPTREGSTGEAKGNGQTASVVQASTFAPLIFSENAGMFIYELMMPISVKDKYLDLDLSLRGRIVAASIAERRGLAPHQELFRVTSPSFIPLRAVSRSVAKTVCVTKPLGAALWHCWLASGSHNPSNSGATTAAPSAAGQSGEPKQAAGSTSGSNVIHLQVMNRFAARMLTLRSVDVHLFIPPPSTSNTANKSSKARSGKGAKRGGSSAAADRAAAQAAHAALEQINLRDFFKITFPATTHFPVVLAPGEQHALLLKIDPQLHSQSTPVVAFPYLASVAGPWAPNGVDSSASGLSTVMAKVILTWTTPRLFGDVCSTYTVRLAAPDTQDVAIDLLVAPPPRMTSSDAETGSNVVAKERLDDGFALRDDGMAFADDDAVNLDTPVGLGSQFRVSVSIANVGEHKRDFSLMVRDVGAASSSERADSSEGASQRTRRATLLASASNPILTTSLTNVTESSPAEEIHHAPPILCLDRSVHVGELGPRSVTRASVEFRAVREGIWQLPRMQLHDSLTHTTFDMPGNPCRVVVAPANGLGNLH